MMNHMIRNWLLTIVLALLGAFALCAPAAGQEAKTESQTNEQLLAQAAAKFQEAREALVDDPKKAEALFLESIADHRAIIESGVENGKLYYNIGNAYLLSGDIGRALVNYRRAERLIPTSDELQANIAVAESRVPDRIESKTKTRVVRTLLFWHFNTLAKHRWLVFVIAFGAMWLMLSLRLLGARRFAPRWLAAACGVIAMAMAGSVGADVLAGAHEHGVITQEEVIGRTGPGVVGYEPAFQSPLHAGVEFELKERRDTWVLVELEDGRQTWLPRASIELI